MAESDPTTQATAAAAPAPDFRLVDRRAFVGFPPLEVAPGLTISDFALQIPEVSFPFNLSGGAARYQRKRLAFGFLDLTVDAELIARTLRELSARLTELKDLKVAFRAGYLEGQALLSAPEPAPLTFKVAFDGDGERLGLYLYDVRFYGFCPTPAAQVPVVIAKAVEALGLFPEVKVRGATGFSARILPPLVQLAAVSRGFKMPTLDQARLSAAEVSAAGLRLRFSAGGLPPPAPPDEELMLALEGARAFADAEELIALGRLHEAKEAYLRHGDAAEAHPFAAERLISLWVADPQAHELVLDVAGSLSRRRDKSAIALWAEGVVRERRGEAARAAERYLALCTLSRKQGDDAAAFYAAEAAARAARDEAPQLAVKALHELLGLRPDHLPSLKRLARAADLAQDRAGAIRAYRRLAALARDPAEAADAHVRMAVLAAQTEDDVAGARLHCEAALKLQPDHPDALEQLALLCHRAGEHLRAIKSADRLREVALARHEIDRVGRANLLAGRVWEKGLHQAENALLRYREAASLLPGDPEPLYFAARVADGLGRFQEALAGYQQTVELAGPAPKTEEIRAAAHAAHHALAKHYKARLGDVVKSREHLEKALALDARDMVALEELIPYFRATHRAAELADACEKAGAATDDPLRRAAFWAEAGEVYRSRLARPDRAEKLLSASLELDGHNRVALEGTLALAESRRDGAMLCRCLRALAELAADAKDRARYFRRLAVAARDVAFDLELAAYAFGELLKVESDDLSALGELCALQRKRSDLNGLAAALEQRARAAEQHGDKRLAAAALRELAQVLEARLGRVGEALVALEKATRLSPDAVVLMDLADLSMRCERPLHARKALEDLLALLPRNAQVERIAEVRAKLGRACDQMGDREAALAHYAFALPHRKLDDGLADRLEALYQEAGEVRALTELWAARARALLTAKRPADAAAVFLKSARALLSAGDKDGALDNLNAALDAAPEGSHAGEILETCAEVELERGEPARASGLLARRAALLHEPRAAAKLLFKAGTLVRNSPEERGLLDAALEQDGAFAAARIRRAELTADSEPLTALQDLEVALALPPSDADAPLESERGPLSRRAAIAAVNAKRPEVARRHLAVYAERRPEDLEALRELARLHRAAGAKEPLCDLLGELSIRLGGKEQREVQREYAELSLELGRVEDAHLALRALLSVDPRNTWAAAALLSLRPEDSPPGSEAFDEVLRLLTVLVEESQGAERAGLLERRAALHSRASRTDEAVADLEEAAPLSDHPGALWAKLASLHQAAGDEVAELKAWTAASAREDGVGKAAVPRLLALSGARLAAKDPRHAREGFAAAAQLATADGDRCEAQLGLSDAALALGNPAEALAALLSAAAQGPVDRRVEALLRRARLLEESGDLAGAAEAFERAAGLAPEHPQARVGRQRTLRELEDWPTLAKVLAADAERAEPVAAIPLLTELADLYARRLSDKRRAEATYRKVAQLSPRDVGVLRALSSLLAERGELREAGELLEEAARTLAPAEAAPLLRQAADQAREAGEAQLALKLAKNAHALIPAAGADLLALCRLSVTQAAAREALPWLESLADAPESAAGGGDVKPVLLQVAELAEKAKDPKLAERALRRALESDPTSSEVAARLAALLSRKDPRAALAVLAEQAAALADREEAAQRLSELARQAKEELADVDLAADLLRRAAKASPEPLALQIDLAELYREAGRQRELLAALTEVAESAHRSGKARAAVEAYEELASLAESMGRVDDALRTLSLLREVSESSGDRIAASRYERRRAELFQDAKLDLAAAERALAASFALHPDPRTAERALALCEKRDDAQAESEWLAKLVPLAQKGQEAGELQLRLAKLYANRLHAPERAEAALREALQHAPGLTQARDLLAAQLEAAGRVDELARLYEDTAQHEKGNVRASLLSRAATLLREKLGRPKDAATALLAARVAAPDDLTLTAAAADALAEAGRDDEAAELDSVLLDKDPLQPRAFERHRAHLAALGDDQTLAALHVRRAEAHKDAPDRAAEEYLAAAQAFHQAGAAERAARCEDLAFERAPQNTQAFERVKQRRKTDVRKLSELLASRAQALPAPEAVPLLRERAQALHSAGEALLAAQAYDDLLRLAADDSAALSARADLAAASGGPAAAQPYDRRLLAATALPKDARARSQLRLGHAALAQGAYRDAADALEAVLALDPDGPRGREALSLLAEAYAQSGDRAGQYRTTVKLARGSRPDEAEALYRRAADLVEDPKEASEALLALCELRPSDFGVVERAAAALKALGRPGDLLSLYERTAEAVGGATAAERLMEAAQLADDELQDGKKARALRERARQLDPTNAAALKAAVRELRDAEPAQLADALARLIAVTPNPEEAARLRLSLAEAWSRAGQLGKARQELEAVVTLGGRSGCQGEALEALEALHRQSGDHAALAATLALHADGQKGPARAALLLSASEASQAAGDAALALDLCRKALAAHATLETAERALDLARGADNTDGALEALAQCARLCAPEARPQWALRTVDALAEAGRAEQARDALEALAREHPRALEPAALADRFAKLGAPALAVEFGFWPLMAAKQFDKALALADLAGDAARAREALWALVSRKADPGHFSRLRGELEREGNQRELVRLAEVCERAGARELAAELYGALWPQVEDAAQRESCLEHLWALGGAERAVSIAAQAARDGRGQLLETLLAREGWEQGPRAALLQAAIELLPDRAKALSRELGALTGVPVAPEERLAEALAAGDDAAVVAAAEPLVAAGTLPAELVRPVAQSAAADVGGAELAARLWPTLLEAEPFDFAGWALFARALRRLQREEQAALAEAVVEAFAGARARHPVALAQVASPTAPSGLPPPPGLLQVDAVSMPQLYAVLAGSLRAFGQQGLSVFLHASGGPEAYLQSADELVIGAGALGAFGPLELPYLVALALALGPNGHRLGAPGPVPEVAEAAVAAFSACPSPLAAARVLAVLDDAVRLGDPAGIVTEQVLPSSAAYRAVLAAAARACAPG